MPEWKVEVQDGRLVVDGEDVGDICDFTERKVVIYKITVLTLGVNHRNLKLPIRPFFKITTNY
jgi:hypothetical protein